MVVGPRQVASHLVDLQLGWARAHMAPWQQLHLAQVCAWLPIARARLTRCRDAASVAVHSPLRHDTALTRCGCCSSGRRSAGCSLTCCFRCATCRRQRKRRVRPARTGGIRPAGRPVRWTLRGYAPRCRNCGRLGAAPGLRAGCDCVAGRGARARAGAAARTGGRANGSHAQVLHVLCALQFRDSRLWMLLALLLLRCRRPRTALTALAHCAAALHSVTRDAVATSSAAAVAAAAEAGESVADAAAAALVCVPKYLPPLLAAHTLVEVLGEVGVCLAYVHARLARACMRSAPGTILTPRRGAHVRVTDARGAAPRPPGARAGAAAPTRIPCSPLRLRCHRAAAGHRLRGGGARGLLRGGARACLAPGGSFPAGCAGVGAWGRGGW